MTPTRMTRTRWTTRCKRSPLRTRQLGSDVVARPETDERARVVNRKAPPGSPGLLCCSPSFILLSQQCTEADARALMAWQLDF